MALTCRSGRLSDAVPSGGYLWNPRGAAQRMLCHMAGTYEEGRPTRLGVS